VASNPGHIPAGGRENISVVVGTKDRGGSTLHKGFTVFTNDPAKARVKLVVSGKVKGYMSVAPGYVRLFGNAGEPLSRNVQIIPRTGYPFTILDIKAQDGKYLRYTLKPKGKGAGKEGYVLSVENTKKDAGDYRDAIIIKTDSKNKPSLKIPVYARIYNPSKGSEPKTK